MGYFNFYFLKKLLAYFEKNKKFIITFAIFVLIMFIRAKCFAFTPNPPINYIGFTNEEKTLLQSFFSSQSAITVSGYNYNYILINRSTDNTYKFDIRLYTNEMGIVYLSGTNQITFSNYSKSNFYTKYYLFNLKSDGTFTGPSMPSGATFKTINIVDSSCIGTNRNIYTDSTGNTILYPDVEHSVIPVQIQNSSSISTWDFTNLIIIGDGLYTDTTQRTVYYYLDSVVNNSFSSSLSVYNYGIKEEQSNNYFTSIMIPRTQILTNYQIKPNDVVHFTLRQRIVNNSTNEEIIETYDLGSFTLGITQSQADNINSQSTMTQNQQQIEELQNINENVQETNEQLSDLNNNITDDTVTSTASDLPSLELTNPAEAPLNSIFTIIYNAFCTGEAQDIVFPIPFTNKNITLSPYYVRDMLNNNGGSWVVTFVDLFWQFVIAFFIIKDVSKKVNKIKAGNIENIENENIKEDML